jgi:hypothetical protein
LDCKLNPDWTQDFCVSLEMPENWVSFSSDGARAPAIQLASSRTIPIRMLRMEHSPKTQYPRQEPPTSTVMPQNTEARAALHHIERYPDEHGYEVIHRDDEKPAYRDWPS